MKLTTAMVLALLIVAAAQWSRSGEWTASDTGALIGILFGFPFVALLAWWWFHAPKDDP